MIKLEPAPDLEFGRKLFAGECDFVAGAEKIEALPPYTLPEIAFAGRSNVGKSSLVNALTGRTTLARTSKAPGHTRQLNFFDLGHKLHLVDMPGYGFARVGKDRIQNWDDMIKKYLQGRPTLKRVCLLIDARRGVMPADDEVMKLLDTCAALFQVTLTKLDEIKKSELDACIKGVEAMLTKHPAALPRVIATSSETGEGIPELRAHIAQAALG